MMRQPTSLRRVGRSEIWGWPLFWFAAGLFALLSFFTDCILLNNWSPYWILIGITTYALVVGIVLILKPLVLNRLLKRYPYGLINLLVAAFLGAIKNTAVGYLAINLGLADIPQWEFRFIGGWFNGIIVFMFFGMALGARVEHRAIMAELRRVQSWLVNLRKESANRLAAEREALELQTRENLLPRLQKLQQLTAANGPTSETLDHLREIINQHVRPLSRELTQKAVALSASPKPDADALTPPKNFSKKIAMRGLIRPNAIIFTLALSQWFFAYLVFSAPECNDVLIASLSNFVLLWLFKLALPKRFKLSRGAATVVLTLIAIASATPTYLVALTHVQEFSQAVFLLLLYFTAVGHVLLYAYPASLDADRAQARERLVRVNDDLKHELALFEQQLWLARRNWQFVIHGTVQAALTAALTRLQDDTISQDSTMHLVLGDLKRAERALATTPAHHIDLPIAVSELAASWRGVCTIKVNFTERARRALQGNNDACICVNEILKEAVSNAVRHGQAKNLVADIDRHDDYSLAIRVSNDGIPPRERPTAGVGSRLIGELTTRWSLTVSKSSGLTVLDAYLPLPIAAK